MGVGTWTAVVAVAATGALMPLGHAAAQADPPGCTRTPQGSGELIECTEGVPAGMTLNGTDGDDTITITGKAAADATEGNGAQGGAGNEGTVDGGEGNDTITITGGAGGNVVGAEANKLAGRGGQGGHGNAGSIVTGSGTTTVTVTGGRGGDGKISGAGGGGGGDAWRGQASVSTQGGVNLTLTGGDGGDRGGIGYYLFVKSSVGGSGGNGIGYASTLDVGGSPTTGTSLTVRGGNGGDGTTSGENVARGGFGGRAINAIGRVILTQHDDFATFDVGAVGTPEPGTRNNPAVAGLAKIYTLDGDDSISVLARADDSTVECGSGENDSYLYVEDPSRRKDCESVARQ